MQTITTILQGAASALSVVLMVLLAYEARRKWWKAGLLIASGALSAYIAYEKFSSL